MDKVIITRAQAIERIIKFLALKSSMEILQAETLIGTKSNDNLSDMLGFITYVKDNTLEVTNTVIQNCIWHELNEVRTMEEFYLPRTHNYATHNTFEII